MVELLLLLILVGIGLWVVERYVPMADPIKMIIRAVVIIVVLILIWRVLRPMVAGI